MEYDRKSNVSSFYGGRRSNAEALNSDYPPPDSQSPGMRADSASSFYNPNGPSRASAELLTRPTAGYNSGSYYKTGRAEPVKGGYDEEEAVGSKDDGFDVFADFNNAGPRYSTAFGTSNTGYIPVNSPAPSKLLEDVGNTGPVEMVTVPTLGPEWKASELRELTGKISKEEARERRADKWKEWKRGERGMCGRYFTRKFTVWFMFGLCVAIALVLAFTIPRVPGFEFNASTPLIAATSPFNTSVPTIFSPAPTNFSFPALADLELDTSSSFLPVSIHNVHGSVYDLQTNMLVGTGDSGHFSVPAKSFPKMQLPLNFTYIASNSSDQTWANWHNACRNRGNYPDNTRPPLQFRLVLDVVINGLVGHHTAGMQASFWSRQFTFTLYRTLLMLLDFIFDRSCLDTLRTDYNTTDIIIYALFYIHVSSMRIPFMQTLPSFAIVLGLRTSLQNRTASPQEDMDTDNVPSRCVRRRHTPSPQLGAPAQPATPQAASTSLSNPYSPPPTITVQTEDNEGGVSEEGQQSTVMLVPQQVHGLGLTSVHGMPERDASMALPFASRQFYGIHRMQTFYPPSQGGEDVSPNAATAVSTLDMADAYAPAELLSVTPVSSVQSSGSSGGLSRSSSWVSILPAAAAELLSPSLSSLAASRRSLSLPGSPILPTSRPSTSPSSPCAEVHAPSPAPSYHSPMVSSLSTADKLTRKFPVHRRSMRNISIAAMNRSMKGRGGAAFAGTLLGEGEGLGIDWPDRWTKHKWCLMLSVCTIFLYGLGGLVYSVLTWFQTWMYADVMSITDYDILVLITISSGLLLFTFLIGITGTILNSRPILAIYALLLWPAFASILAIGYTSYKRSTFALDRKLNFAWSQWYTALDRLIIQNALHCCGFYDSMHEVTSSKTCYVRTNLPGCKAKLLAFEKANLERIWVVAFSLVPLHIFNIFVALCCSNHVNVQFGKGIMPKRYRLKGEDVRKDAERILGAVGTVARPGIVRSPSSSVFREDKVETTPLLDGGDGYAAVYVPSLGGYEDKRL
ncbi:hypothetical protein EIP91_002221 [Steccherinum ochraceum]|uniref:Tetraspanin Tsp2 n=1 Tax=Steccherinum ochraceum TaxID=92696 RepID=A0A4R0REQ0_9APHY|nr:hypothetical protein EIP91_002221 [Steccherinum ochraceum]